AQWPVEQHVDGTEGLLVLLDGFQRIQFGVDVYQITYIAGAEIATAGALGDQGQVLFIQLCRGVDSSGALERALHQCVGAHPDRVDPDALGGGKLSRLHRGNGPRVVDAIGQQYQNTAVRGTLTEVFDSQPDSIADGGSGFFDHADLQLCDQFGHGAAIEGERSLDIGIGGEQDQPQAVALAALGEVADHCLHDLEARQLGVVDDHVAGFHTA